MTIAGQALQALELILEGIDSYAAFFCVQTQKLAA